MTVIVPSTVDCECDRNSELQKEPISLGTINWGEGLGRVVVVVEEETLL